MFKRRLHEDHSDTETIKKKTPFLKFDPFRLREDFPIRNKEFMEKPLVYLDNAARARSLRSFWMP